MGASNIEPVVAGRDGIMSNATQVLVLTGAPGVGKSTVARQLAAELPQCAHVSADTLHRMIVSGAEWPSAGTPTALAQLQLRTTNAALLAASFARHGIPSVVDEVVSLPTQRQVLEAELASWPITFVGLAAAPGVIRARDAGRHKQTAAFYEGIEATIREVVDAIWIDTSSRSIAETVTAVRHLIRW